MAIDRGPNWGAAFSNLGQGLWQMAQQRRAVDEEMKRRQWAWQKMVEQNNMLAERQAESDARQAEMWADRDRRAAEAEIAREQRTLGPWVPAGAEYGAAVQPMAAPPVSGQASPVVPLAGLSNPTGAPQRASDLAAMMLQEAFAEEEPAYNPATDPDVLREQALRDAGLGRYYQDSGQVADDPFARVIPPGGVDGFAAPTALGLAGLMAPVAQFPGIPNPTPYPQTLGALAEGAMYEREQQAQLEKILGREGAVEDRQLTVEEARAGNRVSLENVRQGNREDLEGVKQGGREDLARTRAEIDFNPAEALWDSAPVLAQLLMGTPYYTQAQQAIRASGYENPEDAVASLPYRDLVSRIDSLDGYRVGYDDDGNPRIEAKQDRRFRRDTWEPTALSEALFDAAMGVSSRSVPNADEGPVNRINIDGDNYLEKVNGEWRIGNVNRPGVLKVPPQEILDQYVGSQ